MSWFFLGLGLLAIVLLSVIEWPEWDDGDDTPPTRLR
jgi:hypothetical protein